MISILKKELNSFFASPVAYLVISVYLLVNGLFLWVLKGEFNILNAGYADLTSYFYLAPWLFLFLIPSITMKSFTDEYANGTIEILKTKPLSDIQIITAKFLASISIILFAILPTLTYIYSIYKLGKPEGNLDIGSTFGSYCGIIFIASIYTSIGLFTSSVSNNQIVAFILAFVICFFMLNGFDIISDTLGNDLWFIKNFGINQHYKSISKGVIDTRDLIYFASIIFFFLFLTKQQLKNE